MSQKKDWTIFVQLGGLISRPCGYSSLNGAARRLRLPNDDTLRRAIARMESDLGAKLVENSGERLALTAPGFRAYQLVQQLLQVATEAGAEAPENLVVEVDLMIAETILPLVLPEFMATWRGLVSVKFVPLQSAHRTQKNIATSFTSLGVGVGDGGEVLAPGFGWHLIGPDGFDGQEDVTDLLAGHVVFLPPADHQPEGIETILAQVPVFDRIECPSCEAVRLLVGRVPDSFGLVPARMLIDEPCAARALPDLAPLHVALYLPRERDMTDPARMLVAKIREAVIRLGAIAPSIEATSESVMEVARNGDMSDIETLAAAE
jgi:DNA-binding transcriptional LysR family regulator